LALLPQVGLDQSSLLTLDDLSSDGKFKSRLDPQLSSFILVDHNVFDGPLAGDYDQRIVGIIDHHVDEGRPLAEKADGPRIVEKCGSCTSLVVNHFRHDWNALFPPSTTKRDAAAAECSSQAATLALASILVDTHNLADESKTTAADVQAAEFLISKLPFSFDSTSFFARLLEAKQEIDGLSLEDVLRKDYKKWTFGAMALGISSAARSLSYLAQQQADGGTLPDSPFGKRACEFAKARGLDVYMVMAAYRNGAGDFQRDLFLCGLSARGVEAARKFGEQHGGELDLEVLGGNWSGDVDGPNLYQRAFRQRALHQSRKQVAPMMNGTMAQL
jgi:exopolyphosphatase